MSHRGCQRCAEDHGPYLRPATCPLCRGETWAFRRVLAARLYHPTLRSYLLRLKHGRPGGDPRVGARWLATRLAEESLDLIVPVPNSLRRQLARGVNGAEQLARALSALSGVPWQRALGRRGWGSGQRGRSAHERRTLPSTTFRLTHPVAGHRVALVDDVLTTGATAHACAQVLRDHGAIDICAVVIARQPLRIA